MDVVSLQLAALIIRRFLPNRNVVRLQLPIQVVLISVVRPEQEVDAQHVTAVAIHFLMDVRQPVALSMIFQTNAVLA